VKLDWQFLRLVAICFGLSAALAYYPVSQFATPEIIRSVVAGGLMSLLNLLLGYAAVEISFRKSHTTFLKVVLGGMVVRLMLMWAILLVLVRVYDFHAASLMLSLLFLYVVNLILEIYFLQRKVNLKNQLAGS
jgi:hypothetical protein